MSEARDILKTRLTLVAHALARDRSPKPPIPVVGVSHPKGILVAAIRNKVYSPDMRRVIEPMMLNGVTLKITHVVLKNPRAVAGAK